MITRSNKIFCLCLTGVICLAVGAVMGPRYFSRILDLRDLNTVSIIQPGPVFFSGTEFRSVGRSGKTSELHWKQRKFDAVIQLF